MTKPTVSKHRKTNYPQMLCIGDLEIQPMTFTYEVDQDILKMCIKVLTNFTK